MLPSLETLQIYVLDDKIFVMYHILGEKIFCRGAKLLFTEAFGTLRLKLCVAYNERKKR